METFKGKEIAADFIKLTLWQVLEYAELLNFFVLILCGPAIPLTIFTVAVIAKRCMGGIL